MSDDSIYNECCTLTKTVVRPFVKPDEPAKTRTVQSYDTYSLIRNSYLECVIADYNGGGKWTSVGMNHNDKTGLRLHLLRDDGLFRLCTDQGQFDLHQPKEWIVYVMEKLFDRMCDTASHPDVRRIADIELKSLRDYVVLEGNFEDISWKSSLLSGYKWTALIGSILNRAEAHAVMEKLSIKPVFEYYQGDDSIVKVQKHISVADVSAAYVNLGFEVNPDKTWLFNRSCEYLHEIYFSGIGVFGFPARAARAMIYVKPGSMPEVSPADKINSYESTCRMAVRRFLRVKDTYRRLLKSYYRDWDEEKFKEYWNTPCVMGGFGAGVGGRMTLTIVQKRKFHYSMDVNKELNIAGLNGNQRKAIWWTRLSGLVPIPGLVTSLTFQRIAGSAKVPSHKFSNFVDNKIRLDWNVWDLEKYADAYYRKLVLEWKLLERARITWKDLPVQYNVDVNVDKVYRRYRKVISQSFNVESTLTSGEVFGDIRQWANVVWGGMVASILLLNKCVSRILGNDLVVLYRTLSSTVHSMVRSRGERLCYLV
jgi:hypothetical protein